MSKVICDVCGTTYPETAAQCPICGSAKNSIAQTMAGSQDHDDSYAYVKGGRFSKSNVRKRNKKGQELERRPAGDRSSKKDSGNAILVAIVILLVIAIIAVLGYMGIRVFLSGNTPDNGEGTKPTISNPSDPTGPSTPSNIPCISIGLSKINIEFDAEGKAQLLSYVVNPSNTTDTVAFSSSDPSVATVTDKGLVTAVGGGRAILTVTCGDQQAQCQIICSFGEPTEPSEPTEPQPSVPTGFVLKLNRSEFSLTERYPDPWALYRETMGVKPSDITWTVDDPTVASVSNTGVVSAVGKGTTTVRASYGGQTASCKVIVSFDPKPVVEAKYSLSHSDATIKVGESFSIYLRDKDGVNVKAEWTASVEGYISIKDDRVITGVKSTYDQPSRYITITAVVEDVTYTCIVRVTEPEPTEPTT